MLVKAKKAKKAPQKESIREMSFLMHHISCS